MTEYKVRLKGSDGAEYTISYEGLWGELKEKMAYDEKLGWNSVTRDLQEDVEKLKEMLVSEILVPKAREEILNFLKEQPNIETRSFHHKAWASGYRLLAWYRAKEELEAERLIVSESHGRGKNRTWKLAE